MSIRDHDPDVPLQPLPATCNPDTKLLHDAIISVDARGAKRVARVHHRIDKVYATVAGSTVTIGIVAVIAAFIARG